MSVSGIYSFKGPAIPLFVIFFSSNKLSVSPLQLALKLNWKQPLSAWKHCHKQPEWTDYHCSFTSSRMCSLQTAWMSFSDTKSGCVLYSRARCGSGGGRKRLQTAWKTLWKLKSGSPESLQTEESQPAILQPVNRSPFCPPSVIHSLVCFGPNVQQLISSRIWMAAKPTNQMDSVERNMG